MRILVESQNTSSKECSTMCAIATCGSDCSNLTCVIKFW